MHHTRSEPTNSSEEIKRGNFHKPLYMLCADVQHSDVKRHVRHKANMHSTSLSELFKQERKFALKCTLRHKIFDFEQCLHCSTTATLNRDSEIRCSVYYATVTALRTQAVYVRVEQRQLCVQTTGASKG
jgi:hypothetical protein